MNFAALFGPLSRALNWIKDAYLWLVDWIDDNPQKSLWIATAALIGVCWMAAL